MANIKIYTSLGCGYCTSAKRLLSSLGAPYEEISLWSNPDLADELRTKHNWSSVPMIFIDDKFMGGYEDIAALHKQGLLQPLL